MNKNKENHFRVYIEGIHCAQCVFRLESLRDQYDFIYGFKVHLGDHTAEADLKPGSHFEDLLNAIKKLGFKAHLIDSGWDAEKQLIERENRRLLMKVGVAGAATANIMLLAIAVYGGADPSLTRLFHFVSLILFLPVFFYSSQPFFLNSWKALKQKHPSIDLPIAVALVLGGGLSTWNLIKDQTHQVYFDSLSALVFLLLGSRYFLARTQQKYLSPALWQNFFLFPSARLWKGNDRDLNERNQTSPLGLREEDQQLMQFLSEKSEVLSIEKVTLGDQLLIFRDEKLPVDGKLISSSAYINTSLLTGESRPQKFNRGEVCFAGTQCSSAFMILQTTAKKEETRLGHILNQMKNEFLNRSPLLAFTDQAAQRFTFVVLAIATLFMLGYSWVDLQEALNRTLALIVLACPCAIAFATPLAQSLSLQAGLRQGFLIKNAGSLEKLAQLKEITFDKTGTLTKGEFELLKWHPEVPNKEILAAIYALEIHSDHPIARAFARELRELLSDAEQIEMSSVKEILGKGITGVVNQNHTIEIYRSEESFSYSSSSSPNNNNNNINNKDLIINAVDVIWNGKTVATALLGDQLKADAQQTWQKLKDMSFKCHILTGDRKENVTSLKKLLNLNEEEILTEQSPESKSEFIKKRSHVAMIGDGANDAIAMASATIGIAVKGSMETSLKAADVFLFEPGISSLINLMHLARRSENVIRRNLFLSMLYNSFCGTAALLGYIHPLLAALLMPLNSTIVMASSFWGTSWTALAHRPYRQGNKNNSLLLSSPTFSSEVPL